MTQVHAPEVSLRDADAADALCIGVLATQVFLDTYATGGIRPNIAREVLEQLSTPAVEAMIRASGARFILAERARHLIGFVQLQLGATHPALDAPHAVEIVRLYAQQRFAGQGVGTRLLEHAEALAAAAHATHAWLTAWSGNHRALAFYARRGYADVGATMYAFQGEEFENRVFTKPLRT